MSEASDSQHKRTKSAALSILRRKDRNGAAGGDEEAVSEDGSAPVLTPSSSATPQTMAYQQQMPQPLPIAAARGGHVSRKSTSYSTSPGRLPGTPPAAPPIAVPASPIGGGGGAHNNTLEQSVRKFRMVEALRSGDTASISKAIREMGEGGGGGLDDTTILHLAIQCAEFPVVEYVLSDGASSMDINTRDKDGNTALHLAASQGRTQVVRLLLDQKGINDAVLNNMARTPLDLARNPEIFQLLQLSRSLFAESKIQEVQDLITRNDYKTLAQVLEEPRFKTVLDINSTEFAMNPVTAQAGGTVLHDAARAKNSQLIQVLLLHGADPFRRDRKGRLPQDVTKDDVTRAMLKKSPAAVAAQRGIQEKAVLGAAAQGGLAYGTGSSTGLGSGSSPVIGSAGSGGGLANGGGMGGGAGPGTMGGSGHSVSGSTASGIGIGIGIGGSGGGGGGGGSGSIAGSSAAAAAIMMDPLAGREAREMKGYLKKWTNYRKGYQLRWFVLEDGVLSYYKHQDDAGSACRGAINMRIAKLHMSVDEKTKFEIIGKSSVKYTLKANHEVEAKRWFWALNNSIQWTKDQAKEEQRRRARSAELLRQAKAEHSHSHSHSQSQSQSQSLQTGTMYSEPQSESASVVEGSAVGSTMGGGGGGGTGATTRRSSVQLSRIHSAARSTAPSRQPGGAGVSTAGSADDDTLGGLAALGEGEGPLDEAEDDDDDGDVSTGREQEVATATRDAFTITAQSARLQLETMEQVTQALVAEATRNPAMTLSDGATTGALSAYDAAIRSLTGLVGDLMRISRDRDAFWQYRLDREVEMRRMWEESMAQVAREQEALEARVGEAEEKKRTARRILKEVIGSGMLGPEEVAGGVGEASSEVAGETVGEPSAKGFAETRTGEADRGTDAPNLSRRRTVIKQVAEAGLSDSESEDEEFFDAVDAGEVEVETALPWDGEKERAEAETDEEAAGTGETAIVVSSAVDISPSYKGYENGIRTRLKIDADNRPKLSLWGILKSMVGKDMTKMTLPVTFNEPTSLLYRCGEDMEYADLLDLAAERTDSIERLAYVAAFAASEYASTIGRVAKPFNPLLGETFEYVRPDKQYRFFIEQVSHHPPVGAAWAESPRWTYYGESSVRSKFYGRSFDINPLGTWFLRLRPTSGGREDVYTWKKVTSSVIGIITGNPTVDNYGPMEIKNWTTGEVAHVEFKPRGWTAASAFVVSGKIVDASGRVRMSLGGRWNSRLYARLTPGYQTTVGDEGGAAGTVPVAASATKVYAGSMTDQNKAYLIWQANERPAGIPFNLTPFVLTFNHIDDRLQPYLAPTDSRLRPDQRAMEEGRYDFAATEKNRLEEGQRARKRARDARGEDFVPAYFSQAVCEITGETYWQFNGQYWADRERAGAGDRGVWDKLEPIFA